jgi:hypothetical protein
LLTEDDVRALLATCVVKVGQSISRCGGVWMHTTCLLTHRQRHHDQETSR